MFATKTQSEKLKQQTKQKNLSNQYFCKVHRQHILMAFNSLNLMILLNAI
jgi:hypothetical protein